MLGRSHVSGRLARPHGHGPKPVFGDRTGSPNSAESNLIHHAGQLEEGRADDGDPKEEVKLHAHHRRGWGTLGLRRFRRDLTDSPQMVSELIDHTTVLWDVQKLHAIFCPSDVEAILNIPLCTRRQGDFWAWHHEKRGIFSVRSAYRMLAINKERATAYLENIAGISI